MGANFGNAHKTTYCIMTELNIRRVLWQTPETSEKLSVVRQKNQLASCGDIVASSDYMYMNFDLTFSILRVIGWNQASERRYARLLYHWQKVTRSQAEC